MRRMLLAAALLFIAPVSSMSQTAICCPGAGAVSGGGSGTVTSVALTAPSWLTVAGSPVTSSGTIALTAASQSQGTLLAGPCAGSGAAVFRLLCAADIPNIAESQVTGLAGDLAGKQAAGNYITSIVGDVTAAGPGAATATLPSIVTASTQPKITYNAKGQVTAGGPLTSGDIPNIAESQVTGLAGDLAGKQAAGNYVTGLTGDGTATGPGTVPLTLATVNPNTGTFGSATATPQVTVNGKGLVTAVASVTITPTESSVTFTDITANDASGALHGYMPKLGADDTIFVSNGSVAQPKALPNCIDTLGSHLNYTAALNSFSCGSSGGNALGEATATGLVITDASPAGLEVGPNGSTNPVIRIVDSVASQADGVSITGGAAGNGVTLTAISSGSNAPIVLTAKGTGQISITNPGSTSAPTLNFTAASTASTGFWVRTNHALDFSSNGSTIFEFGSGGIAIVSTSGVQWGNGAVGSAVDTRVIRGGSPGQLEIDGGSSATKGFTTVIADSNGSAYSQNSSTELLTLSTGATTTATSGQLAPANARIKAILVRVTTTITTAANFSVKVTGGNAFSMVGTATTLLTTLTTGTTYVLVPSAFPDQFNASASTVTVTTNVNPGAGAVRITTTYETFTPPAS